MSLWAYISGEGQEHILGSMNGCAVRHRNKRYSAWVAFPSVAAGPELYPVLVPCSFRVAVTFPGLGGILPSV